jgi:hypothetical protein
MYRNIWTRLTSDDGRQLCAEQKRQTAKCSAIGIASGPTGIARRKTVARVRNTGSVRNRLISARENRTGPPPDRSFWNGAAAKIAASANCGHRQAMPTKPPT